MKLERRNLLRLGALVVAGVVAPLKAIASRKPIKVDYSKPIDIDLDALNEIARCQAGMAYTPKEWSNEPKARTPRQCP